MTDSPPKVVYADNSPPPDSPSKVALANATIAAQDTALVELSWLQGQFTTELLKDNPNAARLDELGRMIQRAEKHAMRAERRRPVLRVPALKGWFAE